MIRKTQALRRRSRKTDENRYLKDRHTERVLRETWWLLWIIPVYSRETIIAHNL